MKKTRKYYFLIVLLFFVTALFSQKLKQEFGIFGGAVSMQTDYGQRGDFTSSYGNVGFGIGATYYISFDEFRRKWNDQTHYFKNHFRLKASFSYMSVDFTHYGDYIQGNSLAAIKMAAMRGSTKMLNLGGQLEFSVFSFADLKKWEPYFSLGSYYVNYDPDLKTTLGDWETDNSLLPSVYLNEGLFLDKSTTMSFSFGAGTRYAKSDNFKLLFDMRWQRFFSNKVDGLDPKIAANKYREWLLFFNIGAIFRLY